MDSFIKLKKWLCIKDSIKLYNRNERGIYSTENIPKGKIIIKIKSKFLIEYQEIYKLYQIDDIEQINSLVAFYLVKLHVENNNFYSPYLDTFPTDLTEHLYYWPEEHINYLHKTSLFAEGFANISSHFESYKNDFDIINEYNKINNIIEINDEYFYTLFIRFRILVGSRIFGYLKNNEERSGMVPYIDLINHSFQSNTIWYFCDYSNSFILESTCDIPKGKEILDNYGTKTNIEFLIYYGFTLNQNYNPILRININNLPLEFSLSSNLDYDNELIQKIKKKIKILQNNHKNILKKINNNYNLINIINDELVVINYLIKNII
jgi:hypothetical protein